MSIDTEAAARLERYVPRIAADWDAEAAGRRWQELDASLCFVDISGFTSLSEKLSRRGRIGAEELTAVLNRVFGEMLDTAYQHGGSLLKFGGDALLLMFDGHDHATRAASAAVEMRSALRSAVELQTSVGRLRLRMSVGIHSGAIHLFRAGTSHQELVVAGLGGTMTTVVEKTARPGEIVVSSGTRDRLPPGATGTARGVGWLLRWRTGRSPARGPISREGHSAESVEIWVPCSLREYLTAGHAEPEHRVATVGFVRFCGVDLQIERRGTDWVAEAIDETMSLIQTVADDEQVTFLGTDINEDGAKAILVAGAPVAREGDEGRLLRVARRLADSPRSLDLHFGINRGHVFTGEVGTEFRSTYTVMGDTVNVAARLMSAAPAQTIYATPGVLDQSTTLFAATALPPLLVKGKEEPVKAYSVGEELGSRSTGALEGLPFVGRGAQMAQLHDAVGAVRTGNGSVVTVMGEAGFGKSRLIREVVASNSDLGLITIRAEPYGSASPYRPLRDGLRLLLGIDRGTNDDMARALGERVDATAPELLPMLPLIGEVAHIDIPDTPEVAEIEPRFRRTRLTAVFRSLMERVVREPTIVVVEDAHWLDEASKTLLSYFTGSNDDRPWLFLITARDAIGDLAPVDGVTVYLNELTPDETERLVVRATQATPLHPHEVSAIISRTGGNPLFVGEMLQIVRDTGSTDELPDSLGSLVGTRIDALPTLTRQILRYVSVLGRSFRISTVREILAGEDLELDAATRESLSDFLEPDGSGRLRFRTAMVRDVAYDGLSYRRREELHRKAAAAIVESAAEEPEAIADQLAVHYTLGNDQPNTWRFARIAAARAMRSFANVEAASQLERALGAGRRLSYVSDRELAAAWSQLGEVRERAGLFAGALDAYRAGVQLVGSDALAAAELLLKRASVRERAGNYPVALRDATLARKRIASIRSTEASRLTARATSFQALVRLRQGKLEDARRRARLAAEQAKGSDEQAALARAYSVMAWAHVMSDDPAARDVCQQALDLYQNLGDLVGQNHMNNNLGVISYFAGNWGNALEHYEQSRDGAERVGNVVDAGFAEANIGEVLVNQRRFEEAEHHLVNAVRVLRATGETSMATFAELQLARIHIERDEIDAADALLISVIEESRESGFSASAAEATLYLSDCSIRRGDFDAALAQLDQAMADAGEDAAMYALTEARLRATALSNLGFENDALAILRQSLETAKQRDQRYDEALLLLAKADTIESRDPRTAATDREGANRILSGLGVTS